MANNQLFDLLAPFYDRLIPPSDPDRLRGLLDLPSAGQRPAPGWMLDAGGGTGRVSALLAPQVERLVISDLSQAMLRQAPRQAAPGLAAPTPAVAKGGLLPTCARVEHLPFPNAAFSRVLVVDAFHHFTGQLRAAGELARVLQPGGRLVIEEPDIRRFSVKLIALGETLLLMGSRFRSPLWIRDQLAACGLQARVETEGAIAWVIGVKIAAS